MSKQRSSLEGIALPWAMPNETLEAIEIMRETADVIRNCAKFGSLRKELRIQLLNQATKLDDIIRAIDGPMVEASLILGVESVAMQKQSTAMVEIMEALENHISQFNRRKV